MKAKKNSHRNGHVVAMIQRHPRKKLMKPRNERRAKDSRNHWSKDI